MEACSSFFLPLSIGHSRAIYLVTTRATYRADDKPFGTLFSELCDKPEDVLPADNKEGVKPFLEKRPAQFSGTTENSAPAAYPWWMPIDIVGRAKADKSGAKPEL